jgi:hypothetical protein
MRGGRNKLSLKGGGIQRDYPLNMTKAILKKKILAKKILNFTEFIKHF